MYIAMVLYIFLYFPNTSALSDALRVAEVVEDAARSCSGGALHIGMDCIYNFLQTIITNFYIFKKTI